MSSGSEVSGEETKVDLPPPEKKRKSKSDSESSDSESAYSESDDESADSVPSGDESGCKYFYHEMNESALKQLDSYSESVLKSGGFDVIPTPKVFLVGKIVPSYDSDGKYDRPPHHILRCTRIAIKEYNERLKEHLEFVKVLKVMSRVSAGCSYFITFEAKDAAGITKTYQAVVFYGLQKVIRVDSFRLKPQDEGSSNDWFWEGHIYKDDEAECDDAECDCHDPQPKKQQELTLPNLTMTAPVMQLKVEKD